nr:MAG TPA: endoplasmic reticulum chaperone [Caudoviricetes sp.]
MYHIRLIKGMSYSGAVTATRRHPDVFTENEAEYTSAMKSGYFEDLTGADEKAGPGKENPGEEDVKEPGKENPGEEDTFSDMNVDELKAYAEANGISLAGAKKKAEILSAIREAEAKAAEARSILREQ